MAESMSPLINRRTTLKDALSMLLDADVQAGIVVDRTGAVLGLVTADMIAERMRATAGDQRFAAVDLETIEQAGTTGLAVAARRRQRSPRRDDRLGLGRRTISTRSPSGPCSTSTWP